MSQSLDRIKAAAQTVCEIDSWHPVRIDLTVHALGIVVKARCKALELAHIVPWLDLEEAKINPLLDMIKYMNKTLGAEE